MTRAHILAAVAASFVAIVAGPAALRAQEAISHASVAGVIVDQTGAAIEGAEVAARHLATNVVTRTTTDREGRFRLAYLRIGAYALTVRHEGFTTAARNVTLTAGGAFDWPVTLTVAGVEDSVVVAVDAPVLETARSQVAGTVTDEEARALPLNGRNVLDLALLVPGVSAANVGGGAQRFAETSAVPGTGLSVGSQRNLSNNFLVDGLSANDDAAGLSGMAYGVDAVDEFQVVTSGGQAELGRALGGYVSLVTRSGSNVLRGDAFAYGRSDRVMAPNALTGDTLPLSDGQYGFSLGGPVVQNRTFFFATLEQRRLNQSGLTRIAPVDAAAINAHLAAVDYRGGGVTTGIYASPVRATTGMLKIDHQVRPADHLAVRYSVYDVTAAHARGAGGLRAPSASSGLDNTDQTLAVSHVAVLSPRTVTETRGQIAYSRLQARPTDPTGPAVSIAGVAQFGTLSSSPTKRGNTLYEVVSNLSHQRGAHAWRAGVDVLYNDLTITFPRARRGSYVFSSLADFLAGIYTSTGFTQTFGDARTHQSNPNVGVYLQDEWKAAPRLTVNAGLRYDVQWLETIETDLNNIAPRLGVAWQPTASGRTVIRANAGIFYDRVPLRALANALLSAGNTTDPARVRQSGVTLAPGQTGAPIFPAALPAAVPSVTLLNLTTMDRHLQNARATQVSAEVEHQLGWRSTVGVGYERLRGAGLIMSINQNVPTCVAIGGNNGCRPDPAYADNAQYRSAGRSASDALHVSFVQRPVSWGSYRVSYSWSTAMTDVGEAFFSAPIDPFDVSRDWGRSDNDQRHRLVMAGSMRTPDDLGTSIWSRLARNVQVSAVLQAHSALPFNITSGVNTMYGTAARPVVDGAFIARNAGVGDDYLTLDLRIVRRFRVGSASVEAIVDAFNLTNRVNVTSFNGNFGTGRYPDDPAPGFRNPLAVADPRAWQFGVRATF